MLSPSSLLSCSSRAACSADSRLIRRVLSLIIWRTARIAFTLASPVFFKEATAAGLISSGSYQPVNVYPFSCSLFSTYRMASMVHLKAVVAGSRSMTRLTSMVRVGLQAKEAPLAVIWNSNFLFLSSFWLWMLPMLHSQELLVPCLGHFTVGDFSYFNSWWIGRIAWSLGCLLFHLASIHYPFI